MANKLTPEQIKMLLANMPSLKESRTEIAEDNTGKKKLKKIPLKNKKLEDAIYSYIQNKQDTYTGPSIGKYNEGAHNPNVAAERAIQAYKENSDLAKTMGSFTPSGDSKIGAIGAETLADMMPMGSGQLLAAKRLSSIFTNPNDNFYVGKDKGSVENTLGAINLLGDLGMIGSTLKASSVVPKSSKILSKKGVETIAKKTNKSLTAGDFLSGKDKEMYEFFKEEERFAKLPKTKNKEILSVYDDFIKRISSVEGKKRMKDLGIKNDELLKNINFVEDATDYGYYRPSKNTVAIHPDLDLKPTTTSHEIKHAVQNAVSENAANPSFKDQFKQMFTDPFALKWRRRRDGLTEIDDILSNLELKKTPNLNKVWEGKSHDVKNIDVSDYKQAIKDNQNATDYFATGSEGKEKGAFLSEVQQYMMNNKIIPKDKYVEITPEMVKNTFVDAKFDEDNGGKYLRLFNIMKANDKNFELISKSLNKMLGVGGAGILSKKILSDKTIETLKKKTNGQN